MGNVVHNKENSSTANRAACRRITPLPRRPCFVAPALFMFSRPCVGESRVRETVDRHVSAVAKLRARFYYLPPVVAALCFDSCLFSFLAPVYRRMSENDDIEVDSDVCGSVSSRSS